MAEPVRSLLAKIENKEHFYIRTGPATSELQSSEIHDYIRNHFYGDTVASESPSA